MKQYICLNHGECNWADENPPREFPLPNGEEQFCPNCGSNNIKEKQKSLGPPWLKAARVVGLVLLLAGLIWLFWPSNGTRIPLKLRGELDCQKGIISLTTTGGDGNPILFGVKGLSDGPTENSFNVPEAQRQNKVLVLFAIQNGDTSSVDYTTTCQPIVAGEETPTGEKPTNTARKHSPTTYRKVEGSEFCISDCVLGYSEIDNLGRVRERRVENYAKCCPANK